MGGCPITGGVQVEGWSSLWRRDEFKCPDEAVAKGFGLSRLTER